MLAGFFIRGLQQKLSACVACEIIFCDVIRMFNRGRMLQSFDFMIECVCLDQPRKFRPAKLCDESFHVCRGVVQTYSTYLLGCYVDPQNMSTRVLCKLTAGNLALETVRLAIVPRGCRLDRVTPPRAARVSRARTARRSHCRHTAA